MRVINFSLFFLFLLVSQEAHVARMSDKVESTCTARGDSAELIIRFFQLDPTLKQEVIFGVHHGYIASTQNIMNWNH